MEYSIGEWNIQAENSSTHEVRTECMSQIWTHFGVFSSLCAFQTVSNIEPFSTTNQPIIHIIRGVVGFSSRWRNAWKFHNGSGTQKSPKFQLHWGTVTYFRVFPLFFRYIDIKIDCNFESYFHVAKGRMLTHQKRIRLVYVTVQNNNQSEKSIIEKTKRSKVAIISAICSRFLHQLLPQCTTWWKNQNVSCWV